jgi:ATP-dependent Lhr-like helicase
MKLTGRSPFKFQRETWKAYLTGNHGLVHAPTGTGKTLSVFLGPVIEAIAADGELLKSVDALSADDFDFPNPPTKVSFESQTTLQPPAPGLLDSAAIPSTMERSLRRLNRAKRKSAPRIKRPGGSQLRILWITPLRALATDTENSLKMAAESLGLSWLIEKRTGDTSAAIRNQQRKTLPDVLITTPESFSLMLTRNDTLKRFSQLQCIVVDEWHELLGTKRGVQTELALARVRTLKPNVRLWGVSATIGNLDQALQTLVGSDDLQRSVMIRSTMQKKIEIRSLIPKNMDRFPWAGHIGTRLGQQVADVLKQHQSTLVFTNTRSQTEIWYHTLLYMMPELAGQIAVHHGSVDRHVRQWIEDQLRAGKLKCCVCTSSLDLGVDFSVVDHVIQIGSPKGNARLIQRAGRSGHQPKRPSRVTFVPTHALELAELAALRDAIGEGKIESRIPLNRSLDVLAQHVVTVAMGGGFQSDELLAEVRTTMAYRELTDQQWQWVLDFAIRGGQTLRAYPDFRRIEPVGDRFVVTDKKTVREHRMSMGTIVSDASVNVKYQNGGALGSVEESFISRVSPGDKFRLGGKLLELVKIHDNAAWVKKAKGKSTTVPRWAGGRMPLSNELAEAFREKLQQAKDGRYDSPEMKAIRPILELQMNWSVLPSTDQFLIESLKNRDGYHLFLYPFAGRLVHEGLAALMAFRMSQMQPISFSMGMNDYGIVLGSPTEAPFEEALERGLLSPQGIAEDITSSLNASEMTKRQFREIARVAGLVKQGYPGQRQRSARHTQASSNMFYDVFVEYDPNNLLLKQAQREVLEQKLEQVRLTETLVRLNSATIVFQKLVRPTPLAFPLIVDQLRDRLTSEKLSDRIARMQKSLEAAADQSEIPQS